MPGAVAPKPWWRYWMWVPLPAAVVAATIPFWPPVDRPVRSAGSGTAAAVGVTPREASRVNPSAISISRPAKRRLEAERTQGPRVEAAPAPRSRTKAGTGADAREGSVLDALQRSAGGRGLGEAFAAAGSLKGAPLQQGAHDEARGHDDGASLAVRATVGGGAADDRSPALSERRGVGPDAARGEAAKGRIAQDVARSVLDRAQTQAQYCYDRELEASPELRGSISFSFVVLATGAVERVVVDRSTLGHARAEACMLKIVSRLRFPAGATKSPAPVTYSWRFGGGV